MTNRYRRYGALNKARRMSDVFLERRGRLMKQRKNEDFGGVFDAD